MFFDPKGSLFSWLYKRFKHCRGPHKASRGLGTASTVPGGLAGQPSGLGAPAQLRWRRGPQTRARRGGSGPRGVRTSGRTAPAWTTKTCLKAAGARPKPTCEALSAALSGRSSRWGPQPSFCPEAGKSKGVPSSLGRQIPHYLALRDIWVCARRGRRPRQADGGCAALLTARAASGAASGSSSAPRCPSPWAPGKWPYFSPEIEFWISVEDVMLNLTLPR